MPFTLRFTRQASSDLKALERSNDQVKQRKVKKALGNLQKDPRYKGLRSHKYHSVHGAGGEEVFDSYVENNTPSAWRILWHYGPGEDELTVLTVTPHP